MINFAFILKDILYLGVIFILSYLFYKERQQLLNRIMARDFEQYEYYEKMFKGEVKELKDQRDDVKKEMGEDADIKKELDLEYRKEKEFLEHTEEDWSEDDIDLKELRERIGKE